jgi:hypothetical protein
MDLSIPRAMVRDVKARDMSREKSCPVWRDSMPFYMPYVWKNRVVVRRYLGGFFYMGCLDGFFLNMGLSGLGQ